MVCDRCNRPLRCVIASPPDHHQRRLLGDQRQPLRLDALQKFLEYGVIPPEPLRFVGELDAPGGLSATLDDATAQILPMPGSTSDEATIFR